MKNGHILSLAVILSALSSSVQAEEQQLGEFLDCKNEFTKSFAKNMSENTCYAKVSKKFCTLFFNLPTDVQEFIDTQQLCQHLGGEVGSGDRERDAEINKTAEENGCMGSAYLEIELLQKYRGNTEVMEAILFLASDQEKGYNACHE